MFPYLWVRRAECELSSVCYHPLNSRTTRNDNTYTIFDPDEGNTNQNDDIWSWGSHTFLVVPWTSAAALSASCRLQMTWWTFAVLFEDCASCRWTFAFNCLKTGQRHFKGNSCPGMLEEFSRTDKLQRNLNMKRTWELISTYPSFLSVPCIFQGEKPETQKTLNDFPKISQLVMAWLAQPPQSQSL